MRTTQYTEQAGDDYRDANTTLFQRRRELKAELDGIATRDPEDPSVRRRVRILRRRLDDVTSQIVTLNMGLVRSYTRRFGGAASADHRAEFEAAGMLGLMRAINSFDPESGAFGQWAFKPIQREVLKSVRDTDHPNLNIGDFEKRPAILKAFRQLQGVDASYTPSDAEVAAAAGVTVGQVRRVLAPPRLESMDQPAHDDTDSVVSDTIASNEPSAEDHLVSKLTLHALETFGLKALNPRELYVIVRRFGLDGEPADRLADIGDTLALSREAVRQIEAKALAKLQHPIVLRKLQSDRTPAPIAG
ncbi:MAG TPA: sigma-70 family RNA polymerase sigma factor [Ilumatobacter sp.]|nr:sigma-70 family RNA polymerase sigma factor [Ilumatobacter sp.]